MEGILQIRLSRIYVYSIFFGPIESWPLKGLPAMSDLWPAEDGDDTRKKLSFDELALALRFSQGGGVPIATPANLVGGFNPSEKYSSIGMIIPTIWENEQCSKPPTRNWFCPRIDLARHARSPHLKWKTTSRRNLRIPSWDSTTSGLLRIPTLRTNLSQEIPYLGPIKIPGKWPHMSHMSHAFLCQPRCRCFVVNLT